jgi:hypothetical protein
MKKNTKKRKI